MQGVYGIRHSRVFTYQQYEHRFTLLTARFILAGLHSSTLTVDAQLEIDECLSKSTVLFTSFFNLSIYGESGEVLIFKNFYIFYLFL